VGIWVGLHLQLARVLDTPEVAITDTEGKAFLSAVQNVMRHYPVTASQVTVDWAALIFAASFMYLPRVAAVRARAARHARGEDIRPSATVFHFNQSSQQPPRPTVDVHPEAAL
jgi:hypothetical protein